jgi:hypothetical protein
MTVFVFIDEEGKLDLYSDHVIVRIVLKPSVYIKPNVSKPDLFWRVNDSTDWELFKIQQEECPVYYQPNGSCHEFSSNG